MLVAILPPGAFFGMALLLALRNRLTAALAAGDSYAARLAGCAAVNAARRRKIFERFAQGQAGAGDGARLLPRRSSSWSRSCCPRKRPTSASTRPRPSCSPSPTRRRQILALGEEGLKGYIKTIGLFNSKAKNLMKTCAALVAEHGGQVPRERDALEALPGVGRKTANVVLNTAFGEPTIAVDTHIFRVANRIGLAPGANVRVVEDELVRTTPDEFKRHAHHWLILHGRYVCKARKPSCPTCLIADLCEVPRQDPTGTSLKVARCLLVQNSAPSYCLDREFSAVFRHVQSP